MVLARPGCKLIGNYASQEPCLNSKALDMEQFSEYGFPRQREHSERRRNIRTEKKWLVHRYLTQGQFAHPRPTHLFTHPTHNQFTNPIHATSSHILFIYLPQISNSQYPSACGLGMQNGWVKWVCVCVGRAKWSTGCMYFCTSRFFFCANIRLLVKRVTSCMPAAGDPIDYRGAFSAGQNSGNFMRIRQST